MPRSIFTQVRRAHVYRALVVVVALSLCVPATSSAQVEVDPATLVYHQITDLSDDFYGVAAPELSADGEVAVFSDAPGTGDPASPNRILTMDASGGPITEVDSYVPRCYCSALIDVNEDGSVVVSSESVQLRVAKDGTATELLVLAGNELGPVRIDAAGETIFFVVRRSTATVDGTAIPRGVWRIDADGDNLRQIVTADDLFALDGVAADPNACCFYGDGISLDVAASGESVVFFGYGADGEHIYGVSGDGEDLHELAGPFAFSKNVAISGDGDVVAYDAIPPDPSGQNEIGVLPFSGGDAAILATNTGSNFDDLLRLSEDGSRLLLTPSSYLIDTDSGEIRQLAAGTPGADPHTALLSDGMARAAMNAEATRFLYAMNTSRCADCPNQHEQLGILDIGAEPGSAPEILETSLDPDELTIGTDEPSTATAEVAMDGELVSVGVVALREGTYDPNITRGTVLVDDGTLGDVRANDDVYSTNALFYAPVVTREDDTGPRTMRFQVEIIGPDGLRQAVAVDAETLTVTAP